MRKAADDDADAEADVDADVDAAGAADAAAPLGWNMLGSSHAIIARCFSTSPDFGVVGTNTTSWNSAREIFRSRNTWTWSSGLSLGRIDANSGIAAPSSFGVG